MKDRLACLFILAVFLSYAVNIVGGWLDECARDNVISVDSGWIYSES